MLQVFGIPKSVGQIYGLLYASPRPLSFSDIVERLEISKGSASQGMQLLRSISAIRVANSESGALALNVPVSDGDSSRREYFVPELSLRQLINGVLRERVAPLTVTGNERVSRLREFAEDSSGDRNFYLSRVKQLDVWRRRLRTILPLLTGLLGPQKRRIGA